MKTIKLNISLAITTVMILLASCEKYVEIAPPINSFTAATAYDNDDLVRSNIAGLYAYNFVMGAYNDTQRILFPAFAADELTYYTTAMDEWTNNEILTANAQARNMWILPYRTIYQCNSMIAALDKSGDKISQAVKEEGLGVAKFFRAMSFLNLVSTFGDVPLVTMTEVTESNNLPRSPQADVYAQIYQDLTDARKHLQGLSKANVYVTEQAVAALQARAYLYEGKWQPAFDHANELISGSLKSNLVLEAIENVFLRSSKETIFAVSTNGSNPSVVNHNFVGRALIHNGVRVVYHASNSLLNAFEDGDTRKSNWIGYFSSTPANSGYYIHKYKLNRAPSNTALAEDQVLIRLSEMYLIRAEAAAQLSKTIGAIEDLNAIRSRAGLLPLPTDLSKENTLLAVEQERRVELFVEYGHRWVDLVRTGRADSVLGSQKPTWKSYAKLFPVPELERSLNPKLTQNPGYDSL